MNYTNPSYSIYIRVTYGCITFTMLVDLKRTKVFH